MSSSGVAIALALISVGLVVARPRGLPEGISALMGAAAFVVAGLLTPEAALTTVLADWNVFLFLLGLMVTSGLAEQTGLFEWLAKVAARHSRGSARVLFFYIAGVVVLVTAVLTNDTAALVLTPIVYTVVVALELEPLPFLFATTFLANAASLVFPISNPLNFIVAESFSLRLTAYVEAMWLPALAAAALTTLLLFALFRGSLQARFDSTKQEGREGSPVIVETGVILIVLGAAYIAGSLLGVPLGIVSAVGASILVLNSWRRNGVSWGSIGDTINLQVFGFLAGMVVVVQGLSTTGVLGSVGREIASVAGSGTVGAVAATTVAAAAGSNIINNLPAGLALSAAFHQHLGFVGTQRTLVAYSTIIGCDLGPNLTHVGSLSAMLWLLILRRRGVEVSVVEYLKIGIILTPITILAAAAALLLTTS